MGPGLIETLIAFCLNFGVGHQQHHFLFVPELQITICQLPPFVNARAKEIAIVHLSKKRNCQHYTFWDKNLLRYLSYLLWSVKVRKSRHHSYKTITLEVKILTLNLHLVYYWTIVNYVIPQFLELLDRQNCTISVCSRF